MLVLRDTRLWEGAAGSWTTAANWRQGIGGATGEATFTSGSGTSSLPSVLTFTGTAGGTATNDVGCTVNVGGLNFAPGAGSYTLAGTPFTLGLNANIRNLSTTSQAISADIAVAGSQWIYGETNSLLTISGGISGTGTKLTKLGAGGLVLSAANTFDGGIDVTAGRLLVDGSLASGVSLASGALLGGSGSLPSLSVATGGLLAFDPASAGLTLPSGNNVTLTSPASFGVASLRTLSGEAINWGSVAPNTYSLLAGTTTSFSGIGNFGENNALVDGDRSMYFESSGTGLQLVVVPEPAGLALAGLGLAAAAWACRKKMGPKDAALRRSR